jgi:hypothetical protein
MASWVRSSPSEPTSMVASRRGSRRDLLRLLARSDEDIRADLERRVTQELDALRQAVVEVRDGVVTVDADGPCRQLVEQLARTVPGVVEVRSRRPDPAP